MLGATKRRNLVSQIVHSIATAANWYPKGAMIRYVILCEKIERSYRTSSEFDSRLSFELFERVVKEARSAR
jgi:hypothetical protein